jgi:hypothetical protein
MVVSLIFPQIRMFAIICICGSDCVNKNLGSFKLFEIKKNLVGVLECLIL